MRAACVLPGRRCARRSAASELRCSACTGDESRRWSAEETTGNWGTNGGRYPPVSSSIHRSITSSEFTCVSRRKSILGGASWSFQMVFGQSTSEVCEIKTQHLDKQHLPDPQNTTRVFCVILWVLCLFRVVLLIVCRSCVLWWDKMIYLVQKVTF